MPSGFVDHRDARTDAVVTADFNADGRPDLAATACDSRSSCYVTLGLGNGDGSFQPRKMPEVMVGALFTADFTSDGIPDLASVNGDQRPTTVSAYTGNGDGTFALSYSAVLDRAASAVTLADFNGDGSQDLLVVYSLDWPDSALIVLLSKGDGTFDQRWTGPFGTYKYAVAAADFNGDGNADLAFSVGFPQLDLHVFVGRGDGTFAPYVRAFRGMWANWLTAADLNGDGALDLTDGEVVLLGNGDATFRKGPDTHGSGGGPLAAADLNGDGSLDLIVTTATGVRVLVGRGDATFAVPPATFATNWPPTALAVADFNLDHRRDVVTAGRFGVSVLFNTTPFLEPQETAGFVLPK